MANQEQELSRFCQLANQVRSQVTGCENDIRALQDVVATTYEGIAENLPKIIDEINTNNDEARALIQNFISGLECDSSNSLVLSTLEDARDRFVTITKTIQKIFKVDQRLFRQINNKITQIEKLKKSILEITSISNDIELLSYNAVFVASQAGSSGAAFSHIAKEIKNLSNFTSTLANRMRKSSEAFEDNYRKFSGEIERINKETIDRLNHLNKNLSSIFASYNDGLRNISDLILQTLNRADSAKERVPRIMAGLQHQGYVRPVLDDITLLNAELAKQEQKRSDETEQANQVEESSARRIAVAHMAESMGEKALSRLRGSVAELDDLLSGLEGELRDIELDRISMVDFFSNKQDCLEDKSSIDVIFDESSKVLGDLFQFIRTSIRKKRDAGQYARQLKHDLANVETDFEQMRNIIRQFNVVKVISKMEIARETSLASNITASSEMFESLTEIMDENIAVVRKQLDTMTHYINESLTHLDDNLLEQETEIETVGESIENSISNLNQMREHLNDAVRAAGNSSDSLFKLIRNSRTGVGKINKIVNQANALAGRYHIVTQGLENHRKKMSRFYPEIFERGFETTRFVDLAEMDKKYAVCSVDIDDTQDFSHVSTDIEQTGELTLF